MKALVVDDSKTIRTIMQRSLGPLGFEDIVEAEDGQQALDRCGEGQPDLITLDWNMPVMNGIEFLKAYRAQGHKTPILMVTTEAEKSRVVEAIKAGVTHYLIKPFTPDQLKERIAETLQRAA